MKKIALAVITAAAALASAPSMARPYLDIGAGASRVNLDCTSITTTCDRSGTAIKLAGGYKFIEGFSVEGGYVSFGNARFAAQLGGVTYSSTLKANALTVAAAYELPLGSDFALNFRGGLASVETKGKDNTGDSIKERNAAPYLGFGASFALSKSIKLKIDADFSKVELEDEKRSVRAVTAGLRFDF